LYKTVEFNNISKRYRLGLTRTSLPSFIANQTRKMLTRAYHNGSKDNDFWALRDVSFDLGEGQSLALIGPNGAGKTTILKLLANITKPTEGEISVNGKLSALIELGAGFHPDLTGRENIFLNGTILGLTKIEIKNRFDEIVGFSELEQFIDTPVKRYSSGMAVRLGFSVAACIEPDILLVDEVLAVGDIAFRHKCMKRIKELLDNGTTLIFVSHNLGLLKAVCEFGLYIDQGKLKYFGNTSKAIDVYNRVQDERRIGDLESTSFSEKNTVAGHIEITKLELIGNGSNFSGKIRSDQPMSVIIHYLAYADIDSITAVLRIRRTDGLSCSVMYSKLDGVQFSIRRGVGYITTVLNPIQLFPGFYNVIATLKNSTETITYSIEPSEWFEVRGNGGGFEDRDAVFEPNRTWDHFLLPEDNKNNSGEN
jgi:lipopolysaccharide transport system ATP-binding protein